MNHWRYGWIAFAALSQLVLTAVACSSSGSSLPALTKDGGPEGSTEACASVAAQELRWRLLAEGRSLRRSDAGPGQLLLSASGETLALDGYTFPDPNGTFADGWAITFTHYIATFDKVSLWTNPDLVPTDQSRSRHPRGGARRPLGGRYAPQRPGLPVHRWEGDGRESRRVCGSGEREQERRGGVPHGRDASGRGLPARSSRLRTPST